MIFQTFEARLGRFLFAGAWLLLGLESLALGIPVMRLESLPPGTMVTLVLSYATGVVVFLAALGLMWAERAKLSGTVFAILTLLWTLTLHLPKLLPTITHGDHWTGFGECFAVFGASWVLAAMMPPHLRINLWDRIIAAGIPYGRACFGVALLIFGGVHFVYHDFTANFIPSWIPERPFLAYFTGAAHAAAGLAILSGVFARLGATLAGIMYASWVILLHIPRVITAPTDPFEWNGVFVASILSASAFIMAATFIKRDEGGKV
jgi:hypothetical protein